MTQKELEREIEKIYSEAEESLSKKWNEYFERTEKRFADRERQIEEAEKSGDTKEVDRLKNKLKSEKESATLRNEQYKNMVDQMTTEIANVNQTALLYTQDQLPSFYVDGYNEVVPDVVNAGYEFTLTDEATVRARIKSGDIELPRPGKGKKINIPKDKRWNTKFINSQITQGIIQGESMDKIAARIFPEIMQKTDFTGKTEEEKSKLIERNKQAAIRNARTLTNGAENQGRYEKGADLEKIGVITKRIWIAVGDNRTRDWHLEMDGQVEDDDGEFTDGNNNKLRFPGDPHAEPETVYNCRCSTERKVIGFRRDDGTIKYIDYNPFTELHQKQIEAERKLREEKKARKNGDHSS